MVRRLALLLVLLAPLAARAEDSAALLDNDDGWPQQADSVARLNATIPPGTDPLSAPMLTCLGTACAQRSEITLADDEAGMVRAVFADDGDAPTERQAIGHAITLLERLIGPRNGSWADHPGNQHLDWDEAGQLDCVSEAVNTRTYLDRLFQAGLLHYHHLGRLVIRYTVLLQHVAFTIIDVDGNEFAVDSWVGANGEEPDILPYDEWRWRWAV